MKRMILLLAFLGMVGTAPETSSAATINASVAASLAGAFKEIAADFAVAHPEVDVVANYGASGSLAKHVITSYSIHYTKLYDRMEPVAAGRPGHDA